MKSTAPFSHERKDSKLKIAEPANTIDGCMQIPVDDRWHLTFNGHKTAQQYEGDDTARIEAIEKGIELVRKVNPDSWAARPVFGKWTRDHKTAREAIDAARAQRAAAQGDGNGNR